MVVAGHQRCAGCGQAFSKLSVHWGMSPGCLRSRPAPAPEPELEASDDLRAQHTINVLRAHVASTLQHFRYDKYVEDNTLDELKPAMTKTRKIELDALLEPLTPLERSFGRASSTSCTLCSRSLPTRAMG